MIQNKAKELASFIKSTPEFKEMNKAKLDIDKNKSLKRQLNAYLNKKNSLYSRYPQQEALKHLSSLNSEYKDFFNIPQISNYINSTKKFNDLMEQLYSCIEQELLK